MKKIQKVINLFGYKSVRLNREENTIHRNGFNYESILFKRYAPWEDDEKFNELYKKISAFTLVDIYRLYELYSLAKQTAKVPGAVIEVGAWRGGSSVIVAKGFEEGGAQPEFYCCDTFSGVANATEKDKDYIGGEHADTSLHLVEKLFNDHGLSYINILKGIFPEETGDKLNDKQFSFCHIDVDVYKSAKQILDFVWPRLSVNGIVVFDDYGFISCNGVTTMVNELKLNNALFVYNLNGHAILVKTAS
jgi:O-methyltransferase